ncbi:hypothetical protein ACWC5G_33550, partial [Streptomyces sp. NPDC001274]
TTLRSSGSELAPLLIREAGRTFPGRLAALDAWVPPWRAPSAPPAAQPAAGARSGQGSALLAAHPGTCDALVGLLGCEDGWEEPDTGPAGAALLDRHPATAQELEALLATG